jgi:hypothetical protein
MIAQLGAATPTRTRKIVLDPITIEGKVDKPSGGFDWKSLPWKWVIAIGVVGGLYWVARRKGGRSLRPLAA